MRFPRKSTRGFTLVELMVSLVAGVIIAISVIGLARTATTSFYEQIRISSVESSVRVASERLRTDLLRAGFMSTGNIKYDPTIATVVGGPGNSRYTSTNDLQSIMITVGGSTAAAKNGLTPDRIRIAGNMTSDDAFRGRLVDANTIAFDGVSDPATARLLATGDKNAAVRNAFAPKAGSNFLLRIVDKHRCQHFVELASANSVTGSTFTLTLAADTTTTKSVLLQSDVGTANCGANIGDSDLIVNPVTRVDWWLGPDSDLPSTVQAVVAQSDGGVEDPSFKFNLYRQQIDATGAGVNGPEIVAEYAVDMKFGLVVHDLTATGSASHKNLDMMTDALLITDWTKPVSSATSPGGPGPQRVRSVQYRIATRAPLADRTANLSVSDAGISRYCVNTGCANYARVRTLFSEVGLLNQERAFY